MKQVWIPRYGKADVLTLKEAPDPTPGEGEVRIAVKAAGVNFADIVARQGLYLDAPPRPFVPGYEVAGVVDRVGKGVTGLSEGQRVLALTRFGGYSTSVLSPAQLAVPIPEGLDFPKAAAIPVTYLTAWHSLVVLGNLRPGQRVLLHAAAGGVGLSALQICKHKKAGRIFGTASARKHDTLREMGLTDPIDYHSKDFEAEVLRLTDGKGVHLVMDAVGGKSFKKSYRCLATGGRLVCFGVSSFMGAERMNPFNLVAGWWNTPKFDPIKMMMENKGAFGVNMLTVTEDDPELIAAELKEVVDLVAQGVLTPVVDQLVPFADAAKAHRRLEEHGNVGKVILDLEKA